MAGPRAKQVLYEKRIPRELWEAALEDYPDQTEKIADFLRAKLKGSQDPKLQKKAIDALLRRGHSYGADPAGPQRAFPRYR